MTVTLTREQIEAILARLKNKLVKHSDVEELCTFALSALDAQKPECTVMTMRTSAGADHYVHIAVGERVITPHKFKEKSKAEYEVAEWQWLLNGRSKPRMSEWLDRFEADEIAARALSGAKEDGE